MPQPAGPRHRPRWAIIFLLAVLMQGCGQTGPLFLPEDPIAGSDDEASGRATDAAAAEEEAAQRTAEEEDERDD